MLRAEEAGNVSLSKIEVGKRGRKCFPCCLVPINNSSVFDGFNFFCLAFVIQALISFRHNFNLSIEEVAYCNDIPKCHQRTAGGSLISIFLIIMIIEDRGRFSPILTVCPLSYKYGLIQLNAIPEMPNQDERSLRSAAWSIVSNAADRSNEVNTVTLFFTMLVDMSFVILSEGV